MPIAGIQHNVQCTWLCTGLKKLMKQRRCHGCNNEAGLRKWKIMSEKFLANVRQYQRQQQRQQQQFQKLWCSRSKSLEKMMRHLLKKIPWSYLKLFDFNHPFYKNYQYLGSCTWLCTGLKKLKNWRRCHGYDNGAGLNER